MKEGVDYTKLKEGVITGLPGTEGSTNSLVFLGKEVLHPERSMNEVEDHVLTPFFMWGGGGTGQMQLAAAILLEITTVRDAKRLHVKFSHDVVEKLPYNHEFQLRVSTVQHWLEKNGGHVLKKERR